MRTNRLLLPLIAVLTICLASPVASARDGRLSNAELHEVQDTLTVLGFDTGGIDGLLGPGTRGAIRDFQRRHRLAVTGIPDDNTRAVLGRELLKAIQTELDALGFDPGPADGLRGTRTTQAVRAFQQQLNAEGSGQINANLLRQLRQTRAQQQQRNEPADIRSLQASLTVLGFQPGGVDGQLGPTTRAAIRAFQQQHGLAADGQANAALLVRVEAERVRFIQQRLKALGFEPGSIDGQPGAMTRAAIRAFEQRQGIDPTGQPTAALAARLDATFRTQQQSPALNEAQVRQTQQYLKALGFDPGTVDGQYGSHTREAVRRYQRSVGLPETGEPSAALLARLETAQRRRDSDGTTESVEEDPISEIQSRLNSLGYNAGSVDGQRGARTEAAIRSFEQHLGMPETGQPSARVLNLLRTTPVDRAQAPPVRGRRLASGNTEVRGTLNLQRAHNGELLGCSINGVQLDRAWCDPFTHHRSGTDNCRVVIRPNSQVLLVKCG